MFRTDILKDSSTYQLIVRRDRILQAQRILTRLGAIKFGQPADAATQSRIDSITDLDRLHAISDQLLSVSSWADLLAEA
jgi:hypothetical protein